MYKVRFSSLAILFLMSLALSAVAATAKQPCDSKDIFHQQGSQLSDNKILNVVSYINSTKIVNQSGCCSWHQGVCGCSAGRAVCCDGSYSPTCGC